MKNKLLILMILILISAVLAQEQSKVLVLNLNYKEGVIKLKDKVIKTGYYPDRKIQPPDGLKVELLSLNNELLYSFKFSVPLDLYVDSGFGGSLSGGLIKLSKTDFALIIPYYDNAKNIVIYEDDKEIASFVVSKEALAPKKSTIWYIAVALLTTIFIIWIWYKKRNQQQHNQQY